MGLFALTILELQAEGFWLYLPSMPIITILGLQAEGSGLLALPSKQIDRPAPVICKSNQTIDVIPAHCLSAVCQDIVFGSGERGRPCIYGGVAITCRVRTSLMESGNLSRAGVQNLQFGIARGEHSKAWESSDEGSKSKPTRNSTT
jgi:hypothetical protein